MDVQKPKMRGHMVFVGANSIPSRTPERKHPYPLPSGEYEVRGTFGVMNGLGAREALALLGRHGIYYVPYDAFNQE